MAHFHLAFFFEEAREEEGLKTKSGSITCAATRPSAARSGPVRPGAARRGTRLEALKGERRATAT